MSEITLSTLVLFFLALPGFVARSAYHSDKFSRAILPASIVEDLAGSLIFAFPLHFICLLFSEWLYHRSGIQSLPWLGNVQDIDFAKVIRLLAANFEETGEYSLNGIVDNAYTNWRYITAYAVMIHLLAGGVGTGVRNVVWKWKLDLELPALFKFRNYWLYRLTGRGIALDHEPTYITIQAVTRWGDTNIIYRGFLASFIVDEQGELLDLLISRIRRANLLPGENEDRLDWVEIEGSLFVLKYSEVMNLNLAYYHVSSSGEVYLLDVRQF